MSDSFEIVEKRWANPDKTIMSYRVCCKINSSWAGWTNHEFVFKSSDTSFDVGDNIKIVRD